MAKPTGQGRTASETTDFGAADLKPGHAETRSKNDRSRGRRIIKTRIADGAAVYIEETMRAGQLRVRTVSVLERWRDTGIITPAMFYAAEQFRRDFETAGLQPHYAVTPLERIDGRKGADEVTLLSRAKRKRQAWEAVQRAGRLLGEKSYRALEAVVGYGVTLKEFARCERWAGKPLSEPVARGILFAALEVLAREFGYE
ncbi:MAG: DUF6456 domain-containing protein [Rhodospirillales bacterium]